MALIVMKSVLEVYDFCKMSHNDVIFKQEMNIPEKYAYLCPKNFPSDSYIFAK